MNLMAHLRYWFVEVLMYALVASACFSHGRNFEIYCDRGLAGHRAPGSGLLRHELAWRYDSLYRLSPVGTLWLFAAGLTLYYLDSKKLAFSILLSGALFIYFDDWPRAFVCSALVLLVVWMDHVRVPVLIKSSPYCLSVPIIYLRTGRYIHRSNTD